MLLDRQRDFQRELGLYERETSGVCRRCVGPGAIVLDIGCGDGYKALGFANLGATVHAFDADPCAIMLLRSNLELNPQLAGRVHVHEQSFPPSETPRATFAKVDIDGGELAVLPTLIGVPTILVEKHSVELEESCVHVLQGRGYRVTVIPNARWRKIYPEHRPLEHNRWLIAEHPTIGQAPDEGARSVGTVAVR